MPQMAPMMPVPRAIPQRWALSDTRRSSSGALGFSNAERASSTSIARSMTGTVNRLWKPPTNRPATRPANSPTINILGMIEPLYIYKSKGQREVEECCGRLISNRVLCEEIIGNYATQNYTVRHQAKIDPVVQVGLEAGGLSSPAVSGVETAGICSFS